jgi:purine-binding chemotaxis protein CheW
MEALLLPIGDDLYAVGLSRAREVLEMTPPKRLPGAAEEVLGAFNLRGEIVPLFDTARLVGVAAEGTPSHIAVVDTAAGPAGLALWGAAEPAELGDQVAETDAPARLGAFRVRERVVVLLDPDQLLAPAGPGG